MPKRYELPDLRPRDLVRVATPSSPDGKSVFYLDAGGGGHWVHFDIARAPASLKVGGWDLRAYDENYVELGRLRDVDPHEIANDWPRLEAAVRAAAPLSPVTAEAARPPGPKVGDDLTREQVAALPAGAVTQDLDVIGGSFVEQWDGRGRGRVVAVRMQRLAEKLDPDFDEQPRPARLLALGAPLDDRKAIYKALADQGFKPAIEALADESRLSPAVRVGDPVLLTEEAWKALPPGTLVQLERKGLFQDDFKHVRALGEGRSGYVNRDGGKNGNAQPWRVGDVKGAVVIALSTPDDPRVLAAIIEKRGHASEAPVGISATGTMVQVGDMVETTEEALTALPVGAVVHLWEERLGWRETAQQTPGGLVWLPGGNFARPWGIDRQAVIIALECHDRASAVKARDAFLARPYKGQEQAAALAAVVEARIKAALDQVSDVGLNDQTISAVAGAVASAHPSLQAFDGQSWVKVQGFAAEAYALTAPRQVRTALDRARIETLDEPAAIEYREAMPEIKSTMKLDMKTETLQIEVPRLPGETDFAYAARAGALVKPQTPAPVPTPNLGEAIMMSTEPTWLERVAEALKPVAAELAAEAKAQTRQAIALGGVEVARAAAHRGIAAAAQALAPQHADRVVQVVDHPFTRWLENGALFLGARAAGKPALAQVGLREVVRTPMEGAVGLLVQAASQITSAVKGALVAADEAARVEQVTGQPEAAQVSAGEVRS